MNEFQDAKAKLGAQLESIQSRLRDIENKLLLIRQQGDIQPHQPAKQRRRTTGRNAK